ncbi:hypothetical protein [Staphylococcus auricularis]|uniref:hypothetical protein n=1 Tax=Staphylococcus auricularis TaxID=29379 RepID=UPI00242E98D3|nr:hypothetical protein [Staphylococcus auricularis]
MFGDFIKGKKRSTGKQKEAVDKNANKKITPQELSDYWKHFAKKVITCCMYAVEHTAERIFILMSFDERQPSIDIFYQINGELKLWADLDNAQYVQSIQKDVIPYTEKFVKQVNRVYDRAGCCRLAYGQIQYEFETQMFYTHRVSSSSIEAHLDKSAALMIWFDDVQKEVRHLPVDSKQQITWGPFRLRYT